MWSTSEGLQADAGGTGRRGTRLTSIRMIFESRLMSIDLREFTEKRMRLERNSAAQSAPLFM
jgi:hypothetical protein